MTDVTIVHQPTTEKLDQLGVDSWPIWEKEVSEFPWHYDAEEICYLLTGKVEVSANGEVYQFGAGDLVTFEKGLSCHWKITQPVKKHYLFR